jgi:putative ABC transport system permease protein
MFRNFLQTAWRQLLKNKLYTLINFAGLATGMAVAMLLGIWVVDELTFNSWHTNHQQLARVLSIETANGDITVSNSASVPIEAALRSAYSTAFKDMALTAEGGHVLTVGDKKIGQWGMWAEPAFPTIFTFRMLEGSAAALKDPASLLLSRYAARALFGNTDPLNRTVRVDARTEMKVGGVYDELPENASFYGVGVLLPWANKDNRGTTCDDDWTDHHFELYAQLADGVTAEQISVRIKDLSKPHLKGAFEELAFQPMDSWYLYDEFRNGLPTGGRIRLVRLFEAIGFLVLILACINFMNLSTARSSKRALEVGLRKTVGSSRGQLIVQFLGESLLTTFLSMGLAIGLALLLFPLFNTLAGKHLVFPWSSPGFWLAVLGFTVFTGLLAGTYPAFYLSGFRPVDVLKSVYRSGRTAALARKILVVVQFTVSIALIIGILVINRQIHYARDRSVGYARAGLITLNISGPAMVENYDAIRNELIGSGAATEMAESSSPATEVENSMLGFDWKGRDPRSVSVIGTLFVTYDFGKTVDWVLKEGRDFSRDFPTDSGSFILNEAAVRYTGLKHPVGAVIRWHGQDYPIIGVIRDMVMESPYAKVQPTFFTLRTDRRIHVVSIRLNSRLPLKEALALIEPIFHRYAPDSPFDYSFTDDDYAAKFRTEEQMGDLAGFFTVLALFISCLGLFGLASFIADQRTREIAVRKVLGASVFQLWMLLSKEFVLLVLLAFAIACPIAWEYGRDWLQAFEYRTSFSGWIFATAGIGALAITIAVVSVQSIKAGLANPAISLRSA